MKPTWVLVLNSGSSSVKYQLIDMAAADDGAARIASGTVERIGEAGGVPDHQAALGVVADELDAAGCGFDSPELAAIGHRVVHGGTAFSRPTLITNEVVEEIRRLVPLAPLHNPANISGIEITRKICPRIAQVAVFDTAFHSDMPEWTARYAIDTQVADKYGVRRYGFHGTSHAFVSRATARLLGKDPSEANVIVLHLGNGASASAVARGRSIETSMGLTPLEGLVMGTRSGDIDPGALFHLARVGGKSLDDIDRLLNRESGLRGLCGDNDMREIGRRIGEGDEAARLAFDIYTHRLRKYIGAYLAVLAAEAGGTDALAFTAGVGENSAAVREAALGGLGPLGIELDRIRNGARATGPRLISADSSRIAVAVIPTDEELEIAQQVYSLVSASS